jgi:hypothetical protein
MKKKGSILFITLGLIMLFAASAFSATAFPSQTNPCGNCHTLTGVLVVTSNATGTVDATVGVPFVLIVNQTGYTGGDSKVAIAMKSGWSDNDQFSYTEFAVEDGTASDLNPTSDEVTVAVTITPSAAGSWTIRLWAAGKQSMVGTSLDILVSVSEPVTTTTTSTTTTTTDTTSTSTTPTTTDTGTTSTTPTTDTGTSTPSQLGDSTLLILAVGGVIVVVILATIVLKRPR